MNKRFHIIITGETGRSIGLQLSKRKCYLAISTAVLLLTTFTIVSYFTTGSYFQSKLLSGRLTTLAEELERAETLQASALRELDVLKQQHRDEIAGLKMSHEAMIHSIHEEHDELKRQHREEVAGLKMNHETTIHSQQVEYEELLADQKVKFDLQTTNLKLQNVRIMNTAVSDLNERSELIESIMDTIGVTLKKSDQSKVGPNSGGPFIPDTESSYDELLSQVDDYLETLKSLPLGKPVRGRLSSRFGMRNDPVNKKKAIHEGVDIKGKRGDRIVTTADGKVIKAMKNGGYGNYVEIDHGNGYVTVYGHMQNYLVRRGERVEQGQVIGQVGSTGRSTGPHLHYEIRYKKKPINPEKFMKIAEMSHTF